MEAQIHIIFFCFTLAFSNLPHPRFHLLEEERPEPIISTNISVPQANSPYNESERTSDSEIRWISEELDDVKFLIYTRERVSNPAEIDPFFTSLEGTGFDANREKTIVLMHGWKGKEAFAENFVYELNKKGDYNIIFILWELLATYDSYFTAANNAIRVGRYAGILVERLVQKASLDLKRVHVIGFSLGAHGVGELGRTVSHNLGKKVARITGLDPAQPTFEKKMAMTMHEILRKEDAEFVDIIHTNSGSLYEGGLSIEAHIGHVDFYPNGGSSQPGCSSYRYVDLLEGCSHKMAVAYFVESINGVTKFHARKCSGFEDFVEGVCIGEESQEMGFHCSTQSSEGEYFLAVNEASPYAKG